MRLTHRILSPIIAICSLPALFFLPLFRIMIASGLASGDTKVNLLNNFGLSEFISINDIYTLYKSGSAENLTLFKQIWDALAGEKKQQISDMIPSLHWGVVFLVFLVLCILIALALTIVSAATKKPTASLFLALSGVASAFIMNVSFNAFAKPFINGAVNLNSILGNTNQVLSLILGNVANFEYMKLGIAYTAIMLIFVVVLILSICAYVEQKNED